MDPRSSSGKTVEQEMDNRIGDDSRRIATVLRGLRYGVVTVVVQDGVVVQLERTEKIRIVKRQGSPALSGATEAP